MFIQCDLAAYTSFCSEFICCVNQGFGKLTFGSGTKLTVHSSEFIFVTILLLHFTTNSTEENSHRLAENSFKH